MTQTNTTRGSYLLTSLRPDQLDAFHDIDRSERIEGFYRVVDGALVGDDMVHESPDWPLGYRQKYIERSRRVLAGGGAALGVWDEDRLVGYALIDPHGVTSDSSLVQLDLFYVTASHRGRGIARQLFDGVVKLAKATGKRGVYISAMPSRNTVDLYRHFGAVLADSPDSRLLTMEPDDIHLVLWLDAYRHSAGSERAG